MIRLESNKSTDESGFLFGLALILSDQILIDEGGQWFLENTFKLDRWIRKCLSIL
jgi:hypothetical protein